MLVPELPPLPLRGRFTLLISDSFCFEVFETKDGARLDFRPRTLRERVEVWRREVRAMRALTQKRWRARRTWPRGARAGRRARSMRRRTKADTPEFVEVTELRASAAIVDDGVIEVEVGRPRGPAAATAAARAARRRGRARRA